VPIVATFKPFNYLFFLNPPEGFFGQLFNDLIFLSGHFSNVSYNDEEHFNFAVSGARFISDKKPRAETANNLKSLE